MDSDELTTTETAECMDVSRSTVLRLIEDDELDARRRTHTGPWCVSADSIEEYLDDIALAHDRWRIAIGRHKPLSEKIAVLEQRVQRLEAKSGLLRERFLACRQAAARAIARMNAWRFSGTRPARRGTRWRPPGLAGLASSVVRLGGMRCGRPE